MANTSSLQVRMDAGTSWRCVQRRFPGVELQKTKSARFAFMGDYPSVRDEPGVAVLGKLRRFRAGPSVRGSGVGPACCVRCFPEPNLPPDLRVCPS